MELLRTNNTSVFVFDDDGILDKDPFMFAFNAYKEESDVILVAYTNPGTPSVEKKFSIPGIGGGGGWKTLDLNKIDELMEKARVHMGRALWELVSLDIEVSVERSNTSGKNPLYVL